jgi:hypothetical protein
METDLGGEKVKSKKIRRLAVVPLSEARTVFRRAVRGSAVEGC